MADNVFSPLTKVLATAEFEIEDPANPGTLVPGKIEGTPLWADNNATDVLTVSADGFSAEIDGSATPSGTQSVVTATGDGNLGSGISLIVLTGTITWDDTVTGATTGKLVFTAEEATPAQASAFRAAMGNKPRPADKAKAQAAAKAEHAKAHGKH